MYQYIFRKNKSLFILHNYVIIRLIVSIFSESRSNVQRLLVRRRGQSNRKVGRTSIVGRLAHSFIN